jgi:hypothetical protein
MPIRWERPSHCLLFVSLKLFVIDFISRENAHSLCRHYPRQIWEHSQNTWPDGTVDHGGIAGGNPLLHGMVTNQHASLRLPKSVESDQARDLTREDAPVPRRCSLKFGSFRRLFLLKSLKN